MSPSKYTPYFKCHAVRVSQRHHPIKYIFYIDKYTLPQKKRNFNFRIFYDDAGPGSVTPVMSSKGNGVFDKLVPGALQKWHLVQISLTYTPPQKKDNFRKVVFLLGKSVEYGTFLGKNTYQLWWPSG